MHDRRVIQTEKAPIMPVPISQAIAHGEVLYTGGQAGFDPVTRKPVSDTFEGQMRQAMRNLVAVVEAAGGALARAIKVTIYVTRLEDYDALNRIYAEFFAKEPPARKVIQCQLLPGLLVEVDAIVALSQTDNQNSERG